MPKIKIDAIAVTSADMGKSIAFYSLLGFEFGAHDSEDHVEPITKAGEVRLMIDSRALMTKLNGVAPVPPNHSSFAVLFETPPDVDAICAQMKSAGYALSTEPWDAFWGQRYATVVDPDGYKIDLFAWLENGE